VIPQVTGILRRFLERCAMSSSRSARWST